ncbi:(d)CMP kinase [Paenibacillus aurantius]|uniref:Cytidylate kinase n=1 Tax=Paenibacillus aurantius TaxID=2918900 RepID=A0AA96L955_9BACL|nr:(d)CMP kinase [Paenibacillus aurantius]WNQ09307.1 (d)CMP kinase [Paenibacillus aurantius]
MDRFNIALDGPAGAGKSSAARLVAGRLGFVYVDTGAMYRAVTWKILQLGLKPEQTEEVVKAARRMNIKLTPGPEGQQVYVDGMDVTDLIRSGDINRNVSQVAQIAEIRELLVDKQKELAANKGIVMDGRDIGTKVLPDAEVKVYLTASTRERAERRYSELVNPTLTLDELEKEIAARDRMDSERCISPLAQAEDAVLLDTTGMSLHEVVEAVLELCRSKVGGGR